MFLYPSRLRREEHDLPDASHTDNRINCWLSPLEGNPFKSLTLSPRDQPVVMLLNIIEHQHLPVLHAILPSTLFSVRWSAAERPAPLYTRMRSSLGRHTIRIVQ